MSAFPAYQDVYGSYQSSLCELIQAIEWGQGHFSLILAHCNSPHLRRQALQDLGHCEAFSLHTVSLRPEAELMFSSISRELKYLDTNSHSLQPFATHPTGVGAIAISGFERVNHIDTLLASADTVRDELRKVFHCPLIWWMSDAMLVKLIRLAPNIHSWFTCVEFAGLPEPWDSRDGLELVNPKLLHPKPLDLTPLSLDRELMLLTHSLNTATTASITYPSVS